MESPPPGYPPDYPPQPPPPTPAPQHAAIPDWAPQSQGAAAAPPASHQLQSSRQIWTMMAVIAAVAVLLVIGGTYGAAGYFSASSRIGNANHALDVTLAHRDAFDNAPIELGLDAPDSKTMQTSSAKFARDWKMQVATIESDEQALAAADTGLRQQQWLTLIRRGNIDSATARVDHARKALEVARTIAAERVKEGQFEESFAKAAADFDAVLSNSQSQNFTAALTAANKMQTDAGGALGFTTDTQFPPEVHDYVADIQAVAKDLVDYFNAISHGDQAGAKTLIAKADTDLSKLQTFDVLAMGDKVDAYYQPLMDSYHFELSKAS